MKARIPDAEVRAVADATRATRGVAAKGLYLPDFPDAPAQPGLAREVVVPGGSRLDFVYGGRDLVEVKSPLEALPLLASAGGEGGPPSSDRPNPALVAALAARRSARHPDRASRQKCILQPGR